MIERNKVYVGDNLDILKTFPDNSIDSVVTDPPYGLGKEPNALEVLQSWITKGYHEISGKGFMGKEWDAFVPQPNFWKEVYRVLKPGGYVLSFAGTRTYDWMVMAVRLAGFEVRDMIAWLYGSGFPKSHDVSKAIDKTLGAEREVIGIDEEWIKRTGFSSKSNTYTVETFGSAKGKNAGKITIPTTDLAKQYEGWGTSLKPALEPIVMARKPLIGTVAQNVMKYGTGGINIDECRVDYEDTQNPATNPKYRYTNDYKVPKGGQESKGAVKFTSGKNGININGRFPANVIHDGSDEVVSLFPNTESSSGSFKADDYKQGGTATPFTRGDFEGYGDSGSASRFFYAAKASASERNWGLCNFEEKTVGSLGDGDRDGILDDVSSKFRTTKKNIHPTVKPLDLMRYLVRLVTPKGGVCLDPFLGSGTTAVACKAEKFDYIGIELIPEYAEIAEARIKAEVVKYDIFDFIDESK